jgi:TusE/DsrC/DsvC family sulfur relay protein
MHALEAALAQRDAAGFLQDRALWTAAFAEHQAAADGIALAADHWEIIEFVQRYYDEYAMAPPMRLLSKAVSAKLGPEKGNSLYLYRLFPDGPAKQACKFAGLPKPISCI